MLKVFASGCLLLGLIPSFGHSQINLGVRLGAGLINDDDYNRYRFLVGGEGSTNLFNQDNIFVNIRGDGEFSFGWYNYKYTEDVTSYYFRLLFDLIPEIGLCFAEVIKPSFGAGLTFGVDSRKHSNYGLDYVSITSRSIKYGFNLKPSLAFEMESFSVRWGIKYRYLFEDRYWEYETDWDKGSSDTRYDDQSLDVVLSLGMRVIGFVVEAGIQAENWVYKYEDSRKWGKWPEHWEYMLFVKVCDGH